MSIARTRTVIGSLYALLRNRLGLNVATQLEAQELSCTVAPDRRLVVLGHDPIAGFARDHGTVADEAAMLALHTLDSTTLLAEPTFVAPGDSVLRTDDPGWRWHCISGHGQSLSDWERRPLGGALEGLATSGHTHAISAITGLQTALDELSSVDEAKAPIASPAFTGSPTAPTPPTGDNSQRIATTAMVQSAIAAAGSSSGGASLPITDGLVSWITGEAANVVVDETGLTSPAWIGTPATVTGPLGFALDFSGTNYVQATGPGNARTYRDGFTVCAWVRPTAQPSGGVYVGRARSSYYLFYYPYGDWKIAFDTRSLSGSTYLTTYSQPVPVNSWAFIAAQWDPIGRCFVWAPDNAWDQLTRTSIDTRSIVTDSESQSIIVGAGVSGASPFIGQIGMYATWARLLSAREIAYLWNGGAGRAYGAL